VVVTRIRGNLADLPVAERERRHIERVRMGSSDLVRPVQRVVTDHGRRLGLRLPRGTVLRDGDILALTSSELIIVAQEATEVLVIAPTSMRQMGEVAHLLGHRHLPAEFSEGDGSVTIVVPDDQTIVAWLEAHQVPYDRQERARPEESA
jgi:urease accessory protein